MTKKLSVDCERWDVVIVPFPFAEMTGSKRRPALVLSPRAFNASGHTVLAMITSAGHRPRPGDTVLAHQEAAGLALPCMVRLKIFTLDNRLIIRRAGHLAPFDREKVSENLRAWVF
jgi:mRNA interferase MazF